MAVPTAVWSGGKDLIGDPADTWNLLPRISNLIYHENVSDWNHWDFILGLNAPQRIYNTIIELMGKFLRQESPNFQLPGPPHSILLL